MRLRHGSSHQSTTNFTLEPLRNKLTVPGGNVPETKTDQVKVTRSLGRIARFRLPLGVIGMPATWADGSSSRDDAAKHKDSQPFIFETV
jgi:hypothetical protein